MVLQNLYNIMVSTRSTAKYTYLFNNNSVNTAEIDSNLSFQITNNENKFITYIFFFYKHVFVIFILIKIMKKNFINM